MKCPKCHYLGFETGDRCRNCGYDFSLVTAPDRAPSDDDLPLRLQHERRGTPDEAWVDVAIDPASAAAANHADSAAGARARADVPLPLFSGHILPDDQPLIRLPAAPRAPLAVRRTPEIPRLKTPPAARKHHDNVPELQFPDAAAAHVSGRASHGREDGDAAARPSRRAHGAGARDPRAGGAAIVVSRPGSTPIATASGTPLPASPGSRRALAALLDVAILGLIDLVVVYFTLKMAALPDEAWRLLPVVPLLAFLLLLKAGYYTAFTAFGGQTIGKMAARIRVVSDDDRQLAPGTAVHRTLAGFASVLTLGAGFAPALLGSSKRALHDRVAHTRVVSLPSA